MLVTATAKFIIDKLYWISPYRWVDEWQKRLERKAKQSGKDWEKIRRRRYLFSEMYIVGWLGLAILSLVFHQWLPAVLAYVLMARVLGILNKELGVVLFGICKITEGRAVSTSGRVIILALCNYLTAGLLFAFLYSKLRTYQINGIAAVSPLSINYAVIQGLSIHFTLSPAYTPVDPQTWLFAIAQTVFCFLFGTIIIALFVSLLKITATMED